MRPTLLVLAAGMGSRYGGLKQIDAVGPNGEAIIDYSIFDAIRAGFGRVVFIIRRDIEAPFRAAIGSKFDGRLPVAYAFQELDMVPAEFAALAAQRQKPWGTAHAIIAGAEAIHEPFAVINADDFYGRDSYATLGRFLAGADLNAAVPAYAMVGFTLRNTLSDHGSVSRAVCRTNARQDLESIVELTKIEKDGAGAKYLDAAGRYQPLTGAEAVSMNMFGFTPAVFGQLREEFASFLKQDGTNPKAECFIPTPMNRLIQAGRARMTVLPTTSDWFGITYRDDKPAVVASIRRLIDAGQYPEKLWS